MPDGCRGHVRTGHYGVDRASGLLDYGAIEARAREVRPALLIADGSAYPRPIDFERVGRIAEAVGARLLVDMAHIAGLVAAGADASPLPHADIVTCTTTKTLRGPRGGVILARSEAFTRRLQSAVFPGVQGSQHSNVLAAKAVCLAEALRPGFRVYGQRVVQNVRALAATLADRVIGIRCGAQYIVTDNLADFPAEVLGRFDIEAIDADGFLSQTFDLYPSEALGMLRTLREAYSNPPFTSSKFVRDLRAKGLSRLAAQTEERRDELEGKV